MEGLESVVVSGEEQYELSGSDLVDFNKTISDVGGEFVDFTGDGNVDILGLNEAVVTGSVPEKVPFQNNAVSTWIHDNITIPIGDNFSKPLSSWMYNNVTVPSTEFTQPLRDATAWTPEKIAAYNQIMRESGAEDLKNSLNSNMQAFGEMGVLGSGMWGGNLGKVYNIPNKSVNVISGKVKWNLGESVVTKSHHNWNKIFGDKPVTINDIKPILKKAVKRGTWQNTGVIRGRGGKIIGDKLELVQEIDGKNIWVGGMKEHSSGRIYINNGAVQ